MRRSLESSRAPMLAKPRDPTTRASTRLSTYSAAPSSFTDKSVVSMSSAGGDTRIAEVQKYSKSVERMEQKRLQEQRFTVSSKKDDDMNKLALAAKLQRAVDRRYSGQDAVYKPRGLSEKSRSKSSQSTT